MKNLAKKLTLGGVALLLAIFSLTAVHSTSAQNSRDSANGQGSLPAINQQGKTVKRTFSLSVHRESNGTVKGQATLHNPSFTGDNSNQKYQLQVDVSCMKVIGNTVFFGGVTKRTNDSNLTDTAYFSVQDNGEPGKGADMISRVFFFDDDPNTNGDPQLCQNNNIGDFPMEVIESGNIQVRSAVNP